MNLPKLPQLSKIIPHQDNNQDQGQNYLVIDVGASAVRAAVIQAQEDGIHVLGYGYIAQPDQAMNAGYIGNLDLLLQTMDQAVAKAINQAGLSSEQLILGLSGALVSGVSTLVRLNRPNAKDKIDDKELKLILERIAQNVLADNQDTVAADLGLNPDQIRLVNAGVTSISLDSYTVASPINFSGKEIEVGIFTAFVTDQTIVALQRILNDLNVDLSSLVTTTYALAEIAISVATKPSQANALVIDIGAGTTSVTLIQNGSVANTQSFPIAGRAISTRLSQSLSMDIAEAETLKFDYTHKAISDVQHQRLAKIIKEEVDIWLHALSIALARLDSSAALPDLVYLTGGGSQLPEITAALNKEKWTKALGFSRQPQVEFLSLDIIPAFFDQTKSLGPSDISLAALALFWLHRSQQDDQVAQAFHHILKDIK